MTRLAGLDAPPTEFAQLVQDALAHLDDPAHLQTHLLTRLVVSTNGSRPAQVGRALRQRLVDTLGQLQADGRRERAHRASRLVQLRYVEGLPATAVRDQLGIGRSQYYVEHRQALEALVSLLWEQWRAMDAESGELAWADEPQPTVRRTCARAEPSLACLAARLPRPLTSFIGRQRELSRLLGLLRGSPLPARLVTLIGPGGIGKTRLALEAAAAVLQEGAAEVEFVDLSAILDAEQVLPTIARALGIADMTGPATLLERMQRDLFDRQLLLVLDNCEQVVEAGPRLVALLRACPRLQVLATGRRPLGVSGEQRLPVPPLDLPPLGALPPLGRLGPYEAIRLFFERARLAAPDFCLTLDNAPAVVEICRRLDGLPLAIELAAARTASLSPATVLAGLAGRLDLLAGGPRDVPERQRTLRASIAWSFDLLDPSEHALLRRLAVCVGSFSLELARAVAAGRLPTPSS